MAIGALFSASETLNEIGLRQEAELVENYGKIKELDGEESGENVRTAESFSVTCRTQPRLT